MHPQAEEGIQILQRTNHDPHPKGDRICTAHWGRSMIAPTFLLGEANVAPTKEMEIAKGRTHTPGGSQLLRHLESRGGLKSLVQASGAAHYHMTLLGKLLMLLQSIMLLFGFVTVVLTPLSITPTMKCFITPLLTWSVPCFKGVMGY